MDMKKTRIYKLFSGRAESDAALLGASAAQLCVRVASAAA